MKRATVHCPRCGDPVEFDVVVNKVMSRSTHLDIDLLPQRAPHTCTEKA